MPATMLQVPRAGGVGLLAGCAKLVGPQVPEHRVDHEAREHEPAVAVLPLQRQQKRPPRDPGPRRQ